MYKIDSRKIEPGDTFICLPKGERYVSQAKENGAKEVLTLSRDGMAHLGQKEFGPKSKRLKLVGITGTNGKSTTAYILNECLNKLGEKSIYIGTLNSSLTTPESIMLQQQLADHADAGGTHAVLEVSSHAICQGRVWGIDFDVKLLTNLTQDHLDYHGSIEAYHHTKKSFLDAGYGQEYLPNSCKEVKMFYPQDYLTYPLPDPVNLLGEFNQENLKAVGTILKALSFSKEEIAPLLKAATAPPGRFEMIEEGQLFKVIVDFAHAPDGLDKILKESKALAENKLIVVFGCGGDRDTLKRPLMGSIADKYADKVILTSDNPRTESEEKIIQDIMGGIPHHNKVVVALDRRAAIQQGLCLAQAGDVLVVAGKGHEKTQVLKYKTIPFDDRDVCRTLLREGL